MFIIILNQLRLLYHLGFTCICHLLEWLLGKWGELEISKDISFVICVGAGVLLTIQFGTV